ncbi:MAG: thioredoxin domain-containing protein, partial [Gammaproteobacteria bacterium]|nr:thioredoxin domain-containing protein [Gammaproteobacteria bacterium]
MAGTRVSVQVQLEKTLRQVETEKSASYEKRTRHKDADGKTLFINRLILEDSPYLLQHAHNPVNWYAWGEEAFATALRDNKPVFLSIGYSTCHWCHVMEGESFDDVEMAKILNQHFISIKLDREQYPDIDEIYMTGVQIMSGQGGWPMSNFLFSDGKPFFSGTYFPPAQFAALLSQIASLWQEKREELEQSAIRVSQTIEQVLQSKKEILSLDMEQVAVLADEMLKRQDKTFGGLAGAPKFPQEPLLLYFLEGATRSRDQAKLEFSVRALEAMGRGGIYDQVAGGFHRYSTDVHWLVPHFEKMLYNQSQLSRAYLLAWRLTGDRFFLRIIRQTLDFVLREMTSPQGGFYSAMDADSEDQEGLYFIWSIDELEKLLSGEEMALCRRLYDLSETGNFEGANILALSGAMKAFADGKALDQFEAELDKMLLKLRKARELRIAPLRDDKLIVAWAAAMATSLAWAGQMLHESAYLEAAEKAVNFIWDNNFAGHDTLRRIYLNGVVSIPAQLEDYANLCEALIALFDVTQKRSYLNKAATLMSQTIDLFWNDKSGGFFLSQELEQGPMLARSSSASDTATISAYAVALDCLVALAKRVTLIEHQSDDRPFFYQEKIRTCLNAVSADLVQHPAGHTSLIRAVDHHRSGGINLIQYAGEGQLRVQLQREKLSQTRAEGKPVTITIALTLAPGFHLSAGQSRELERVPLDISVADDESHWRMDTVKFPPPSIIGGTPEVAVYDQSLELEVLLHRCEGQADDLQSNSIGLKLQV